jgi:hypothetical protein
MVRYWGAEFLSGLDFGMLDALDHRGFDVRVDERATEVDRRAARIGSVSEVWYVATEPYVEGLAGRPGARILARTTPLGWRDERRLAQLQARVSAELVAEGRSDLGRLVDSKHADRLAPQLPDVSRADLGELTRLNRVVAAASRCRCALVALPKSSAPPSPS